MVGLYANTMKTVRTEAAISETRSRGRVAEHMYAMKAQTLQLTNLLTTLL